MTAKEYVYLLTMAVIIAVIAFFIGEGVTDLFTTFNALSTTLDGLN